MTRGTRTIGPRLTWATIAALLVTMAALLTFCDSPKVFGQDNNASSDATLSALTLSGIDFGTFDSATLQYTVQVSSHVDQTVVTVTRNHSKATYLVKLGGVTETDGVVSLSAGSNVITVEVTAEDGQTMKIYSVTVTRPVSDNAYLYDLTLSDITIEHGSTFYPPGFSSIVFNYAPSVANSLTETTVTPRVAHSFATYIIKLDGVTDADGVIALSVGRNVITIEVTAEDGETTKTYTITVTRAPAPMTDATLKSLLLSGIDIGGGVGGGAEAQSQTSFTASVYHSVSQTTVSPTVNHSGASYVTKLGGGEDADGTISLAVGSNVITVEVTAEDDSTTKTYTVTVNRATASAPTTGELSTDDPPVNFRVTDVFNDHTIVVLSFPRNRGITGWVIQRYEHDGDEFVSSGTDWHSEYSSSSDIGGEGLRVGDTEVEPGALYKWVAQLTNSQGSTVIETSLTVRIPSDETTELSSDATLSGLTLSGVDFGTFASGTTSYTASVANNVSQTTVTPTVNHSGASYVIKLDGVEDADGVVSLSVGSNVITTEVTAEDGATTRTYTVTVTRLPSTDTTAPTIASVAITSDPDENDADLGAYIVGRSGGSITQSTNWVSGVYRIGDHVRVTVTFSEDVTVTGSPKLELAIGSNNRTAEYEGTDGSAAVFSYTVAEGDSDDNGIAINANKLTLNGGSIKDAANNDADLSHNSLAAQAGHEVDGVRPRLKLTASDRLKFGPSSGGSDGAYTTGEELVIRVEFTEGGVRGSVTGPPGVTLNFDGGGTRVAMWDPSLIFNPTQYPLVRFFSYVVQEGDLDSDGPTISANAIDLAGGFIRDATGNDAILTHSAVAADSSFIVDAVAPTVSSIAITSDPGDDDTYGTGDKIEVTVTFSENMSIPTSITCSSDVVHCKAELELDIGGTAKTADYQSHDGAEVVYAYTVQAGDTDDNGIAIGDNKLTGQRIMDATGKFGYAINDADLSHDALTDDAGHKVGTSSQPPKSTDATLSALTLSGVNFGTFASGTTSYTAQVANSVTQTTVTPTVNDSGASHVIKLGGVEDADGVVSLVVGSNVITIEVTAEDDSTTRTYTVTVTRAAPPSTDSTLSALTLSDVNFGTFDSTTTSYTAQVANSVSQTTVTPAVNDSGASYVVKLGGATDADGVIALSVGSNVITIEVTAEDDSTTRTYTVTVTRAEPPSTDATLSALTLSGVDFGTFASGTTSYTAQVANSVTQTMVTPTVNDSGASYVIKLGAVVDADGVVLLSVGSSVITVAVTAEDDSATRTYTVTVTRAEPPTPELSSDATLNALTLSGIDFGTFDSTTVSYTAQVANSVTQTTVTPTVNDSGASYVIKLGGVTDADGVVMLSVGSNVLTVEVTAEDVIATRTYTVTVTRAAPPSTDATLSALTLSGVDFGTFDSTTTSYTAQVANGVSETTVTPTVNDSGASYVIKLGGVEDADGEISLAVGSNVITVEVTAEDGNTARTYTVTVTRAAPASTDATLGALTLSGVDFGTFDSTTVSYTTTVANDVSQTTVTPTVNHSGASYVIKLGGTIDSDGVIPLSVGSNTITIEVTAEDGNGSLVYTLEVTRSELPTPDILQRMLDRYDANNDDVIDKAEAIAAITDYFADRITRDEVLGVITLYFSADT